MTAPLPLPDDPNLRALTALWNEGLFQFEPFPRSKWLKAFEDVLREHYPQASSQELSLTARHAAPFPLRDGPNVP